MFILQSLRLLETFFASRMLSNMFEKIIKIRFEEYPTGSCIVRLTSDVKNSYQFELDRIAVSDIYQDKIEEQDPINTEEYANLFKDFGYSVEFIEPELTIEI